MTIFTKMDVKTCLCGNTDSFEECCGAIHQNIHLALTAEQLMRSRYSAFVKANGDYLQLSHHSTTRPNKRELKDLLQWTKSVQWIKLDVLRTEKGLKDDTEATVEFKAYFYSTGKLDFTHEVSSFVKENGHWVYFGIKNV